MPKVSPGPDTSRKARNSGQEESTFGQAVAGAKTEGSSSTGRRATCSNPVGSVDQGQSGNPIPYAVNIPVTAKPPQLAPGMAATAQSGLPIKQKPIAGSANPNRNRSSVSATATKQSGYAGVSGPIGISDSNPAFPFTAAQMRVLQTFDTQNPPFISLTPVQDQSSGMGQVDAAIHSHGTEARSEEFDSDEPSQHDADTPALDRFCQAVSGLPSDKQSELTAMFRQFLGDRASVGSAASEALLEEESGDEESESPSFRSMWHSFCGAVRDWVPSVPEVVSSPVKRRRTVAALDRSEPPPSLPLHPDVSSSLDFIMQEVKEVRDKSDALPIGKFLKQDRLFPRKQWAVTSKPKLHFPQIKLTRTLEQLIPGLKNSTASISDMELQGIESQLRESLVALSHLKWLLDTQWAFYT